MNIYIAAFDPRYPDRLTTIKVGHLVTDLLTQQTVEVKDIVNGDTFVGIWTDSDYLGGARHPWEIYPIGE